MENKVAVFANTADLEHAVAELRKQGVVDITVKGASGLTEWVEFTEDPAATASLHLSDSGGTLQVVVESSRVRQAEDTIEKYGGSVIE